MSPCGVSFSYLSVGSVRVAQALKDLIAAISEIGKREAKAAELLLGKDSALPPVVQ